MKKLMSHALHAALALAFVVTGALYLNPPRVDFLRIQNPVVQISYLIRDSEGNIMDINGGSGFTYRARQRDDGMWESDIVTAKHVVAPLGEEKDGVVTWGPLDVTRWIYKSGEPLVPHIHHANVLRVSEKYDLALVRVVSFASLPTARVSKTPARLGDSVITVGFPTLNGFPNIVSPWGHVSVELFKRPSYEVKYQITSAIASPGNSGGPLYNSRFEIVGVVVALGNHLNQVMVRTNTAEGPQILEGFSETPQNHIVFPVPLNDIREFLNETE